MVALQRLYPTPVRAEVDELLDELRLDPVAADRPYVVGNLIGSVDGRAADALALTGPHDRALFHGLRGRVDAVLLGARTAAAEPSGRLVAEPEHRAARVARGLEPEPIALVVTEGGEDDDHGDEAASLADPEARPVRLAGEAGLGAALRRARSQHGVRTLVSEAGPEVTGRLLGEGLVDELFVTVSPVLVGGGAPLALGGDTLAVALELVWVLEAGDCLFLRYAVRGRADEIASA